MTTACAATNLLHSVDWLLWLPENLEQQFKQQLEQLEAQTQMRYVTSIERIAREEGREEGRKEGPLPTCCCVCSNTVLVSFQRQLLHMSSVCRWHRQRRWSTMRSAQNRSHSSSRICQSSWRHNRGRRSWVSRPLLWREML